MTDFEAIPPVKRPKPGTPMVIDTIFGIGDVVRHRLFDFRGVIYDIDPVFSNSEEWYQSIPEEYRPSKNQPFYHLFAENGDSSYTAYVSQQNLLEDGTGEPVGHPEIRKMFQVQEDGSYKLLPNRTH